MTYTDKVERVKVLLGKRDEIDAELKNLRGEITNEVSTAFREDEKPKVGRPKGSPKNGGTLNTEVNQPAEETT